LRPYDDTAPAISPEFPTDDRFKVVGSHSDDASGFKYLLFQHEASKELIVAFAGTDGIDYRDWGSNALALGWNQWQRNHDRVLSDIGAFSQHAPAIHFTGQSLGGALAEYAAYQWIERQPVQSRAAEQARTTLTTFNGLGSEDALRASSASFDTTFLGRLSQSAAYWVRNDLVARLGGGHSGVPVYQLDHLSYRHKPSFLQTRDDQYWDLDLVDAHRIEFGLYSGRRTRAEFEPSAVYDAAAFQPLEIGMTESQRVSRMSAAIFNGKFRNDTEAVATIVAGLIGAAQFGNAAEVTRFSREIVRSMKVSGVFAVDDPKSMALRDNLYYLAENLPIGEVLKAVANLNQPNVYALHAGAIMVALGARYIEPHTFSLPFRQVLNVTHDALNLENPGALPLLFRALIQSGVVTRWSDRARKALDGSDIQLSDIAIATLSADADWLYDTQGEILAHAASDVRSNVAEPGEQARRISTHALDLLAWLEEERTRYSELDPTYAGTLRKQIVDFAALDVAQALVNTRDVLQPVMLPHANVFGGGQLDFASYDRYRDAIADAVGDPDYAHTRDLLESALERVDRGGERVAIAALASSNPFDSPAFSREDAVVSAPMVEGQTRSFTLFLPYAADVGGQRVSLALSGPSSSSFVLASENGPVAAETDGTYSLFVAQGRREIALSIRTRSDVDVDSTLTLSAQLTNDAGTATHQRHDELALVFDATVEPTTNPSVAITGTAQDDNRNGDSTHRPVNGSATADHIRTLAGRDEAAGLAGDDLIEGGAGADIVAGDDGHDRLFADAAMDDLALRNYIASTAAIIDDSHPAPTSDASAMDWIVGDVGSDTVVGTAAGDILFGGGGSDLMVGGAGHDIIDGDDDYRPGALAGVQAVRAYAGLPHQMYFSSVIWNRLARNVGAADEIHGGAGDDFIRALYGDDTVFGDNGDDVISGDVGNDSLFGNAGNDRIAGGAYASDSVLEPSGNDYIDGGDGSDVLSGESGADVIVGGAGDDVLHGFIGTTFTGAPNEDPASDGDDYLSGGSGADMLIGSAGADTLVGGDHADQLFGDSEQTPTALHGNDELDGGAGDDYLRGYGGDDRLLGGPGNDVVHGESGADRIDGGTDDDDLFGMEGDDTLLGGAGEDQLVGDDGADILDGAIDDDQLWGGAGDDRVDGGGGNDYLDGGEGADTLAGGAGADWIYARAGDDVVTAGADNDVAIGGDGADSLHGGDGDDQLWGEIDNDEVSGGGGDDQVIGGGGSDALKGGDGLDQIWGDAGDDTLDGGAGRDYLLGGAGNDVYLVDSASEDIVVDSEGQNTLRFANDVYFDELRFRQGIDATGVDRYLVIEGIGSQGRVIVRGGMDGAIARFEFADGTSLTHAQVLAQLTAQGDT
jgi:Ca2+-binding RTX toxin-like protein